MKVLNVAFDYQTGATRWTRSHMTRRDLTWTVRADSADVEMIRSNWETAWWTEAGVCVM